MIFGKTKVAPTFAEQMSSIKAAFKTAHENANNLHSMMEEEIKSKESQIASLKKDIETINVTKKEAETFMENISKLI
jgi:hypothetical protein